MSGRTVSKREVTQEFFEQYVKDYPNPLLCRFSGDRSLYVESVALRGGTWSKPVALKEGGKFILIEDV